MSAVATSPTSLDPLLQLGDEGVVLAFERPLPAWAWALIVLGVLAAGWWSYRGLIGPVAARAALGVARVLLLGTLAVLFSGPRLERPVERTEPDWTVFLIDRSASMGVPDTPGPDGTPRTRADAGSAALREAAGPLSAALTGRGVLWLGFDAGAFELARGASAFAVPELAGPSGARSSADAALRGALARVGGRPVSAIVLVSDGRFSEPVSRATLDQLAQARVPIHAVPVGSVDPLRDVSIERAEAPAAVFAGDVVPVRAIVRRRGGSTARAGEPVIVRLVDVQTGAVLDEQIVTPGPDGLGEALLTTTPARGGEAAWSVVVEDPDSGADLLPDNDRAGVRAGVIDRPVRALYIDGYPRWEQRYVKSLMLREPSIEVSAILLAADRRSIQEGDRVIGALPITPEDWSEFDLVVFGDVDARLFSPGQLEALREHVARRGAGLLWMAGPRATPASWASSAMSDLLPMTLSTDEAAALPVWDAGVVLSRTGAAERLGLLALSDEGSAWPGALSDPATGWAGLRWAHRVEAPTVKPAAEVLALASSGASSDVGTPAVLTMRFGAGRVGYVATDETWRWRYARGEDLQERFWIPLMRALARGRLAGADSGASLAVSPDRTEPSAPVRVTLDVVDTLLEAALPERVSVTIEPEREPDAGLGGGVRALGAPAQSLVLTRDPQSRSRSSALWTPDRPGAFVLTVRDAALSPAPTARALVVSPDDELSNVDTDHAALVELAQATGGRVHGLDELARLSELPNRSLVLEGTPQVRRLWDNGWVLGLLLGLLAAEWLGRRAMRLA